MNGRGFLLAAALALATAACASATGPLALLQERLAGPAGRLGPAPPFWFETFQGERVSLDDLAGQAVVLNFWASWCVPCRAEMPHFEEVYREQRARGVVFVGLAVQDDPQSAREFTRTLGITYPTGMDPRNETALRYEVTGLPTTVFIARDGAVVKRWAGPISERELAAELQRIV